MKAINPNYQVSVCAAWSPNGIDGRYYDYQALAAATDYLYVMCYDTRSQIFDQCVASANAPANLCKNGIEAYRQIGVPDEKLILGIPWYGYRYECVDPAFDPAVDKTCEIAQVPFRGVNCSDAAGTEVAYSGIRSIINSGLNSSAVMRDSYMNVPFFNYVDPDTSKVYQVRRKEERSDGAARTCCERPLPRDIGAFARRFTGYLLQRDTVPACYSK